MTQEPDPEAIGQIYKLPPIIRQEKIEPDTYRLATADKTYLLKVYAAESSLDIQRYIHWLLLTLKMYPLQFDIACPLRDTRGATIHIREDKTDEAWVLFPDIPGQPIQPGDPDHAYATGAALAEFLPILAQLPPHPRPDLTGYTLQKRILPALQQEFPAHPTHLGLQDTPEGNHRLRRFNTTAREFQKPLPPPDDNLPWQIVHGNFAKSSLRYDGERVTGVVNFDRAHPDYRVYEFARTLIQVCGDPDPLFWGISRAFVEGYRQQLTLTAQEITLVPHFMVAWHVEQVMQFARTEPEQAAKALQHQEEVSAWLESERRRLLTMLQGIFLDSDTPPDSESKSEDE